jgi:hypothetical protein
MADLIETARVLADAGTADWTLGTVVYWGDDEVQRVLDRHRMDVFRHELSAMQTYEGGTVVYKDYYAGFGNIESGTAVFGLETAAGSAVGTANYSFDHARGKAVFTADQAGSAYFLNGRRYDVNAAAADIWRVKAANVAKLFNFSTDGHRIDRGELRKYYLEMCAEFEAQSEIFNVKIVRDDE